MENTELTALVSEMRAEFQIPPYYEDSQLAMYSRELKSRLQYHNRSDIQDAA